MNYHKILVANTGEDTLILQDLRDYSKFKTLLLSKLTNSKEAILTYENNQLGPYDLTLGNENIIYVTNAYDNSIMKIDIENNKLLGFLKVGRNPTCLKSFKEKIYVANTDSNSISIIDEKTFSLIEDIAVGEKPTDIQIDEETSKIFIANANCYTINILDLNREKIQSIVLSKQPIKMIIESERLFVLSYINNGVTNCSNLSELQRGSNKIIRSIDLKGIFGNMVKIKGKDIFYLSNGEDGSIYKIILNNKVDISKIYLGGLPNTMKWDGETRLYIANALNNHITIIDEPKNQICGNIRVGKEPNGILLL